MNFDDVINKRHTDRKFTDEQVLDEQIKKIVHSASLAPSAKNRQPWKFYILSDKEKNHITNMLFEWEKLNKDEKTSVKGSAEQIKSANKMVIIYTNIYNSKEKNLYYKKPDYISLGCAIENMSLQAINLGLGSCILCDTLYIEDEINEYLGIRDYEQVCGFIVGYPINVYPPKRKKDLEDLLLNDFKF